MSLGWSLSGNIPLGGPPPEEVFFGLSRRRSRVRVSSAPPFIKVG